MNTWAVPLLVAAIAAAATLGAAYVTFLKDRRNVREHILKDLEIAEKLEDDQAKALLLEYVRARALMIPLEADFRSLIVRECLEVATLVGLLAASFAASHTHLQFWRYFVLIMGFQLLGYWQWSIFNRARAGRFRDYAAQHDIAVNPQPPSLIQRWRAKQNTNPNAEVPEGALPDVSD